MKMMKMGILVLSILLASPTQSAQPITECKDVAHIEAVIAKNILQTIWSSSSHGSWLDVVDDTEALLEGLNFEPIPVTADKSKNVDMMVGYATLGIDHHCTPRQIYLMTLKDCARFGMMDFLDSGTPVTDHPIIECGSSSH